MSENKNEELSILCNKVTPQKQKKIRNPFDKVLVERLHQPLCSPGMCKIYKSKSKGTFLWDIEETCILTPAEIIECNSQYEGSPDPVLEKIAVEATEKFFSQELVVPSPMEPVKKQQSLISKTSRSSHKRSTNKPQPENRTTQTELTFPPTLPPEIEKILQSFCTYSQEDALFDECEKEANGSLRVKTVYTQFDNSDHHYDSEQTDDESHDDKLPQLNYVGHSSVEVSPDLSTNLLSKGTKRTFDTPTQECQKPFRNKILDVEDFEPCFSPIQFATPKRTDDSASSTSLMKAGEVKKSNSISPNTEAMATCLDCVHSKFETKARCFCTLNNIRSKSHRESPKNRSLLQRSSSMTSLNRSRSVQKLDFSMDMSVDGSNNMTQGSESTPEPKSMAWSLEERRIVFQDSRAMPSSTKCILDETPIKGKRRTNVAHEISKIRDSALSPLNMSLDSMDNFDIPLSMERKIDFTSVDLDFLTDTNRTVVGDSFKRIDNGLNDFNASSYYGSAIKPSELTTSKCKALTEISNNWTRVDSGFKDEDSQYEKMDKGKENVPNAMSMSDFDEGLKFACNFSSTPSSSKRRFNF